MKRKFKRIGELLVLTSVVIASVFCMSCGKKAEPETTKAPETTKKAETTKETTTAEPKIEGYTGITNLLTGFENLDPEAEGKRPVAVMVNNVYEAMPQYGIGEADVIFEIPIEDGNSRLLAIFPNYKKVPDVCSIRSYRYYFPAVALGFDAFYIHWGEDKTMMDYYYSLDMDAYDGLGEGRLFGRDQNRLEQGYALEHTSVFYGTDFANAVHDDGLRTDLDDYYKTTAFNFYDSDKLVVPDGDDCPEITVDYGWQPSTLKYDASKGKYLKYNFGDPHIDGNTGKQLEFTNAIILCTDVWIRDDHGHRGVDWQGGNGYYGYYLTAGKIQEFYWYKPNEYSRFSFTDAEGNEIQLNKGKTYITFCRESFIEWE